MKPWTTPDQCKWLTEQIPQWHKRHEKARKGFLEDTVNNFLKKFPDFNLDHSKLPQVSVRFYSLLKTEVDCSSIANSTMVQLPWQEA